jgi:hypothetical protein
MQVVADGTVYIEERRGFDMEAAEIRVSFAQLFIGMLALQLRTTTRREYLQRRDVLLGWLHWFPV